jgi:hypothetical protein
MDDITDDQVASMNTPLEVETAAHICDCLYICSTVDTGAGCNGFICNIYGAMFTSADDTVFCSCGSSKRKRPSEASLCHSIVYYLKLTSESTANAFNVHHDQVLVRALRQRFGYMASAVP